jgi:hypothetical protein
MSQTRGSKNSQQISNSSSHQSSNPTMMDDGIAKLIEGLQTEFTRRFDAQEARFMELRSLLTGLQAENTSFRAALDEKEQEILGLRRKTNDNEQYARSWSIRILDLPVPKGQNASDTDVIMRLVFNQVLLPIFEGAVTRKLLPKIPSYNEILETAHILPTKPNQTAPIIARFFSRNMKSLVFRLKRDFGAKQTAPLGASAWPLPGPPSQTGPNSRPAKLAYPFYEDLTTANFKKMQAIAQDNKVLSCWSVAGQLRFRLHGEERVRKVLNIYATVDDIIQQQT